MINDHLCFGKLGRCCRHLPHGGRWAARQQGKDQDLNIGFNFLVRIGIWKKIGFNLLVRIRICQKIYISGSAKKHLFKCFGKDQENK